MADFAHCIRGRVFTRRTFLVGLAGIAAGFVIRRLIAASPGLASEPTRSLLSVPLELGGVWKSSPADAVLRVLSRVREVSLEGLRLLSDRQPDKLYVDDHPNCQRRIKLSLFRRCRCPSFNELFISRARHDCWLRRELRSASAGRFR